MNFRKVTPQFLDVARLYQEDMAEAMRYLREKETYTRMGQKVPPVDARDFVPMVALKGIKGETREERNADIHEKLDRMTEAFDDPDESERDEYLDLIFYLVDDFASVFDPAAMNMTDPTQVAELLQSTLISQTIGTKAEENPRYYSSRYPTPEARSLVDVCSQFLMTIGSTIMKNLLDNDIFIDIELSLPKPLPDEVTEIQYLREEYEKSRLDKTVKAKGNLSAFTTADFPIPDSMVPCAGKNVVDIENYSKADYDQIKNYYRFLVENSLLQSGTKNTQGLKEAGIGDVHEAVYVDGKPLADFVKEHFPNSKQDGMQDVIVGTCMLSGKHKVDIVNAYRDEAGEMQFEAKTLRVAVTPAQEKLHLEQFSWLRRLFNWPPFRIETLQEKMDRIANDPDTQKRLDRIVENHKEKIETGIAKKAASEQAAKLKKELQEQRREAYEKAKDRLEESAAQWDKDSVLGLLGQQVTAAYEIKGVKVSGICNAIRKEIAAADPTEQYDKISPLVAKVVLYSQLCSERAANGGEPGETEKLLGAGSSIRENIENTARRLAMDPVFKNIVLKKMGTEENNAVSINRSKFEALIASGGCKGIWVEYQQNLKNMSSQKEQQAAVNEAEPENRLQPDAPQATM